MAPLSKPTVSTRAFSGTDAIATFGRFAPPRKRVIF
jgi:hypothetical protein